MRMILSRGGSSDFNLWCLRFGLHQTRSPAKKVSDANLAAIKTTHGVTISTKKNKTSTGAFVTFCLLPSYNELFDHWSKQVYTWHNLNCYPLLIFWEKDCAETHPTQKCKVYPNEIAIIYSNPHLHWSPTVGALGDLMAQVEAQCQGQSPQLGIARTSTRFFGGSERTYKQAQRLQPCSSAMCHFFCGMTQRRPQHGLFQAPPLPLICGPKRFQNHTVWVLAGARRVKNLPYKVSYDLLGITS